MIPTTIEFSYALTGAWRLLKVDRDGLQFFDDSRRGFLCSFFAAVLVLPFYLVAVGIHLFDAAPAAGPLEVVVVEGLAYAIKWLAYPVILFWLCELMQKSERYFRTVVALNWTNVVQAAIYFPVVLIQASGLFAPVLVTALSLGAKLGLLAYQWFVTKHALAIPGTSAAGLVVIDLIVDVLLPFYADTALGLSFEGTAAG